MRRAPAVLGRTAYDVLVVGGGIFGACAAWEAASRGLKVALVERGDFGHATSANSYKIVHGGMRYLQHADLPRVWESCRERSALLRVAPHLVHPMPILVPTYGRGMKGKAILRTGFAAYDLLTMGRNRGIRDPERRIPKARFLSRDAVLRHYPDLSKNGLTGAALFCDAQMYNPPRLTLGFLKAASEAGADVVNYVEAQEILRDGSRVYGAQIHDLLDGREIDVRAAVVLNAAGPWATHLAERWLDVDFGSDRPTFSRDVGLVTRKRLTSSIGLACPAGTRDSHTVLDRGARHLFLLPWREFTLVGVWHGVYNGSPNDVLVTEDELRGFVDDANRAYSGLALRTEDILMVNTGLILFGQADQAAAEHDFGKRSLLVDHRPRHGIDGVITLVGVRATTARASAETAVSLVFRKLGRPAVASATRHTPIPGGDISSVTGLTADLAERHEWLTAAAAAALAHNYGSQAEEVLALAEANAELRTPLGDSSLLAEVAYAVRHEMACTLADVVLRRTDLGTGRDPGHSALEICAARVAQEADWDDHRLRAELAELRGFFSTRGARRVFNQPTPATTASRAQS